MEIVYSSTIEEVFVSLKMNLEDILQLQNHII